MNQKFQNIYTVLGMAMSPFERENIVDEYGVGHGLYDGDYNKTYNQIENDDGDQFNRAEIDAIFTNYVINKQTGLDRKDLIKDQSDMMSGISGQIPSNTWDDTEYDLFYKQGDKRWGESKASENWEDMELDGSEWSFTDSNEDVISCNKCGKTFNVGSYPRSSRAGYDVMEWDAQTHSRLHEPNPEGGRGWTHPDNKRDPYNFYNDGTPVLRNESKATEKGEWDWLDKGADSKSVDYDEVKYEDDGVSDISVQNTEPKGADANEFLDNVNFGVESVDYVYPTKASEAMGKTYIPVSEAFEEEYEEFEDSDEEMIRETITLRKLTGYGDSAIARELHIKYGVSHEEAFNKISGIEVSTNDKVAQTFFGKMYKECNESEKDELRMYSGSD